MNTYKISIALFVCFCTIGTSAQNTTVITTTDSGGENCPSYFSNEKRDNGCRCHYSDLDDDDTNVDADLCKSGCCINDKCASKSECDKAIVIGMIVGLTCLFCCCAGGAFLVYLFMAQSQNRHHQQQQQQPTQEQQYFPPPMGETEMQNNNTAAPPSYDASAAPPPQQYPPGGVYPPGEAYPPGGAPPGGMYPPPQQQPYVAQPVQNAPYVAQPVDSAAAGPTPPYSEKAI